MEIPKGFKLNDKYSGGHILKLYKICTAIKYWSISQIYDSNNPKYTSVYSTDGIMYALYTDYSILAGLDPKEIDNIIAQMQQVKLDITVEGPFEDFLGINVKRKNDGKIHLTQ